MPAHVSSIAFEYTILTFLLLVPVQPDEVELFSPYRRTQDKFLAQTNVHDTFRLKTYPFPDFPEYYFRWQQRAAADGNGPPLKLKISAFLNSSGTTVQQFWMSEEGVIDCRTHDIFSVSGSGDIHYFERSGNDELERLLARLPPSTIGPALADLLCISHKGSNGEWITKTFDIKTLPGEVKKLLAMTGFYQLTSRGKQIAKREMHPKPRF